MLIYLTYTFNTYTLSIVIDTDREQLDSDYVRRSVTIDSGPTRKPETNDLSVQDYHRPHESDNAPGGQRFISTDVDSGVESGVTTDDNRRPDDRFDVDLTAATSQRSGRRYKATSVKHDNDSPPPSQPAQSLTGKQTSSTSLRSRSDSRSSSKSPSGRAAFGGSTGRDEIFTTSPRDSLGTFSIQA